MTFLLRLRCWWLGVCYRHAETKEADVYGPAYCQSCREEGRGRSKQTDDRTHERRMELIQELRLRR